MAENTYKLNLLGYKNRHSKKSQIVRAIWNIVWLLLARWTPERGIWFFNSWRIFLLRLFGAKIGKKSGVMSSCEIWQPWNLVIGDYVSIAEHVVLYNVDQIKIGDQVVISREAFLCAGREGGGGGDRRRRRRRGEGCRAVDGRRGQSRTGREGESYHHGSHGFARMRGMLLSPRILRICTDRKDG